MEFVLGSRHTKTAGRWCESVAFTGLWEKQKQSEPRQNSPNDRPNNQLNTRRQCSACTVLPPTGVEEHQYSRVLSRPLCIIINVIISTLEPCLIQNTTKRKQKMATKLRHYGRGSTRPLPGLVVEGRYTYITMESAADLCLYTHYV